MATVDELREEALHLSGMTYNAGWASGKEHGYKLACEDRDRTQAAKATTTGGYTMEEMERRARREQTAVWLADIAESPASHDTGLFGAVDQPLQEGDPAIWNPTPAPTPDDPWKHRSSKMTCATCMWYVRKAPLPPELTTGERPEIGRCRRHAPSMNGYPAVYPTDWCGDHKVDETKL